jgi:hypothetical protein
MSTLSFSLDGDERVMLHVDNDPINQSDPSGKGLCQLVESAGAAGNWPPAALLSACLANRCVAVPAAARIRDALKKEATVRSAIRLLSPGRTARGESAETIGLRSGPGLLALIGIVGFGAVASGCPSDQPVTRTQPNCPKSTHSCGYGCLANTALCCNQEDSTDSDDGTFACPDGGVVTCAPNPTGNCRDSTLGTSTGASSRYCCATKSDPGSFDCLGDTVVCNLECVARGSVCCSTAYPSSCGTVGGLVQSGSGSGNQYCYSTSSCIPSVMSNTCECAGSTTPGECTSGHPPCVATGGACGNGTACCVGETCINGRCESGCGQCAGKGCRI